MAGGFLDSIESLIDIYSKCLGFLKQQERPSPGQGGDPDAARLRKAIRKDRSSIKRAYGSQSSLLGGFLDDGDDKACSKLRRIIRRLIKAAKRCMGLGSRPGSVVSSLQYQESLLSLSNSSRKKAIDAINELSRRRSSSGQPTSSSRREKRLRNRSTVSRRSPAPPSTKTRRPGMDHKRPEGVRLSYSTLESNSTKLGEVRRRDRQGYQRRGSDNSLASSKAVSPARAVYPLRPYNAYPETGKKRGFWGIFSSYS